MGWFGSLFAIGSAIAGSGSENQTAAWPSELPWGSVGEGDSGVSESWGTLRFGRLASGPGTLQPGVGLFFAGFMISRESSTRLGVGLSQLTVGRGPDTLDAAARAYEKRRRSQRHERHEQRVLN